MFGVYCYRTKCDCNRDMRVINSVTTIYTCLCGKQWVWVYEKPHRVKMTGQDSKGIDMYLTPTESLL